MKEFWNSRYGDPEWAYGKEPNAFFKARLAQYKPGKMLLPAEGEGRNAVYAARMGWEVHAFDLSEAGKAKADQLAKAYGVNINYQVAEFSELTYEQDYFDCIGLIYAHFPAAVKSAYHQTLSTYLQPGGVVIFEAFSKAHLHFSTANPKAGGPKDIDMLFSTEEIKQDFNNYRVLELAEVEVPLTEGLYHQGLSSVIRFVGVKQ